MENIEELWATTLLHIREKVAKASFDTWLRNTKLDQITDDHLIISAPNEFALDWLENRYTNLISDTFFEVTGTQLETKFIIHDKEKKLDEKKKEISKKPHVIEKNNQQPARTMLNNKYTFDTFVIGSGNRFAHAASLAVAEAPAKAYNPLFIYGGVGLGKTHLMHAIGHYILE